MPVVPADHGRRGHAAGQVLPLDAQCAGRGGTDGVEHRVVPGGQVVDGDVGAHLDPEFPSQPRVLVEAGERLTDLLRGRVVGCDPVPDESPRRGQPVDERHPCVGVQQQVLDGVHPGGSGPDHRDVQRRHVAGHVAGEDRRRPRVEVRRRVRGLGHRVTVGTPVGTPVGVVGRVELRVGGHRPGEHVHRHDRVDRARVRARAAVDAARRVDVEHLGAAEVRLVRCRVDAVDRADRHAGRVVAAGLGDRERHRLRSGSRACRRGWPPRSTARPSPGTPSDPRSSTAASTCSARSPGPPGPRAGCPAPRWRRRRG